MSSGPAFVPPPAAAAWRFRGVRRGGERVEFVRCARGVRARGLSRGVDLDEGMPWRLAYDITWDHRWRFRAATVRAPGVVRRFARDEEHGWSVDGKPAPEFVDCLDLDLQVSCLTNTAPARRAAARTHDLDAPAVYVTSTLGVERLTQGYRRLRGPGWRFAYDSPEHDVRAVLPFAADGLVTDYPFLGVRVGRDPGADRRAR